MPKLPIGEAAVKARTDLMLQYVNDIVAVLAELDPDPGNQAAVTAVTAALGDLRKDPTDPHLWAKVHSPASFARGRAHSDSSPRTNLWDRLDGATRQGSYMSYKMLALTAAAAPICDEHGPMANSDDPTVFQSHDGARWHCVDAADCMEPYWWIDGTHLHRAPARQS